MKITRIKLTGYIGIYNGLGLETIEIDTSKSMNKVLMIVGDNGCGKTTLWSAWTPLPDENSCFIPNIPASKEVDIDNKYFIKILHGVKSNGDRDTPKIYFHKLNEDDELIDLNPNLNVNSYKEELFTEFGLDPNFISLTELGQQCRGLADLKPAERKKYINALISDLVDYNDMYKVFTKRSSIYKSFINNTQSKISSIGDKEYLINTLNRIETRLNKLLSDKDILVEEIAKYKSMILVYDPDGSIQETYNLLCKSIISLSNNKKELVSVINGYCTKNNISSSNFNNYYNSLKDEYNEINTNIKVLENENSNLLSNRESKSKELQKLTAELDSINTGMCVDDINKELSLLEEDKSNMEKFMKDNNIIDRNFNIDELVLIQNTINSIGNAINNIRSSYTLEIIQSLNNISNIDYEKEISYIENKLSIISNEISSYNTLLEISSILSDRPSDCNIDSCSFISKALDAINKNPKENIDRLEQERAELSNKLIFLKKEYEDNISRIQCNTSIDMLYRNNILNCKNIFNKVNIVINKDNLIDFICRGYYLSNELSMIDKYIEDCNVLCEYKAVLERIKYLNDEYNSIKGKLDLIKYLSDNMKSLANDLVSINKSIDINDNKLSEYNIRISEITTQISELEYILIKKQEYDKIDYELSDNNSKLYTIQASMKSIQESLSALDLLNVKLENINKEISPMIEDRDTIKHSLKLLEEYLVEYEDYKNKYTKIELMKKYSSPSKGIGLVYMALYLNSTLNIANDLLNLVFDGKYILPPFEIDETSFKIPCLGNAIRNDDISSMSGGEIAIISMILSFSILHQSSTQYNIFKLDELDGPLDNRNRVLFVNVLYRVIEILQLDQVVIISHNQEIPMSNVDVIVLKTDNEYDGNIIYKYSN